MHPSASAAGDVVPESAPAASVSPSHDDGESGSWCIDKAGADSAAAAAASAASKDVEGEDVPSHSSCCCFDACFSSVPDASSVAVLLRDAVFSAWPESVSVDDGLRLGLPIHFGITCDGCGTAPILGVRYNCSSCGPAHGGFDLCQECEDRGRAVEHDATHEFAVHVDPVKRVTAAPQFADVRYPELARAAGQRVAAELSAAAAEAPLTGAQVVEVLRGAMGEAMAQARELTASSAATVAADGRRASRMLLLLLRLRLRLTLAWCAAESISPIAPSRRQTPTLRSRCSLTSVTLR